MITDTINNQAVDVEIIEPDGRSGTALDQAELDLIAAVDTCLRNYPDFVKDYPSAQLTRVDSNRMLEDTEEGRVYLRYHHDGGDTEFWGHRGTLTKVDLDRGVVEIPT